MNAKLFNWDLIKYEFRNTLGNVFIIIFGVGFPILMTCLCGPMFMKDVPEQFKSNALTTFFIGVSTIIPLATVFMGYAANFSQELEKGVPIRFKLFGYKDKTLIASKLIANLILVTISMVIYTTVNYMSLDLEVPTIKAVIILIISLYVLTIVTFTFAHGLALMFKKFAPTNAITMILYFVIMILSGLFGVVPDDFPKVLRFISYLLPTTYISQDFIVFWQDGSYNFAPFIQSFIFFAVVSLVILIVAVHKDSRVRA